MACVFAFVVCYFVVDACLCLLFVFVPCLMPCVLFVFACLFLLRLIRLVLPVCCVFRYVCCRVVVACVCSGCCVPFLVVVVLCCVFVVVFCCWFVMCCLCDCVYVLYALFVISMHVLLCVLVFCVVLIGLGCSCCSCAFLFLVCDVCVVRLCVGFVCVLFWLCVRYCVYFV